MSRHRNIRNLTDDDYYDYDEDDYYDEEYDDYGYDDDNGYTAEENEAYYREQQRLKEEEERVKKNKSVQKQQQQKANAGKTSTNTIKITTTKNPITPAGKQQSTNKEQSEKERLVVSMGFTSQQARDALERHSWDVELAINSLLSSPVPATSSTLTPPGFNTNSHNTVRFSKDIESKQPSGVMAPPPGWSKPTTDTIKNIDKSSKKESKSKDPKVAIITNTTSNQKKRKDKTNEIIIKPKIVTKPKKKLSKDLLEQIKGQKSRLSMVILGHVDAGKSTLMGQVLVQVGIVQQRTIVKYQKEGM